GRRSQRDPSGAQARCDPRALPRQVALPFLTGPLWPPPEPHRRLLARDEGHHQRWTMVWHSPATLSAHAPGAHGASRAPHLCVPLVAHSASNFAGPAQAFTGQVTSLTKQRREVLGNPERLESLSRTQGTPHVELIVSPKKRSNHK